MNTDTIPCPTLPEWRLTHPIDPDMRWRRSALEADQRMIALADELGLPPLVDGTHRSKSIDLPVLRLNLGTDVLGSLHLPWIWMRDNFYDVEVGYAGVRPPTWSPPLISWEEYAKIVNGVEAYVLKTGTPAGEGGIHWARRWEDPAWYHGYSLRRLYPRGPMADHCDFIHLVAVFRQGMPSGLPPWTPGSCEGVIGFPTWDAAREFVLAQRALAESAEKA